MIPHNSQKNNEKYSHNGYCYVKDKESADGEKICYHARRKRRKYEEADQRILKY
jgi:hypothetical protein